MPRRTLKSGRTPRRPPCNRTPDHAVRNFDDLHGMLEDGRQALEDGDCSEAFSAMALVNRYLGIMHADLDNDEGGSAWTGGRHWRARGNADNLEDQYHFAEDAVDRFDSQVRQTCGRRGNWRVIDAEAKKISGLRVSKRRRKKSRG